MIRERFGVEYLRLRLTSTRRKKLRKKLMKRSAQPSRLVTLNPSSSIWSTSIQPI